MDGQTYAQTGQKLICLQSIGQWHNDMVKIRWQDHNTENSTLGMHTKHFTQASLICLPKYLTHLTPLKAL